MGFYQDNKNFIIQKIHSEMKGLSNEEKLIKYELIKIITRSRLKKSYLNSNNISKFYEEAFEQLSFYETEYLLLNLFFERDADNLFTILSFNTQIRLNFTNKDGFSSDFWNFMDKSTSINRIDGFLKTSFIQLIDIDQIQWEAEDAVRNDITRGYANWLINSNKNSFNQKSNIFSYILFSKIWNYYDLYTDNFEIKAIIFYNTINKNFENLLNNGVYVNLNQIIIDLKILKESLFVKPLRYYPLLDYSASTSTGYIIQLKEFIKNIDLSKDLCKSYESESFDSLFYEMLGKSSIICEQIHKELNKKLNNLEFPNAKELDAIIKIEDINVSSIKQDFLRRMYIY